MLAREKHAAVLTSTQSPVFFLNTLYFRIHILYVVHKCAIIFIPLTLLHKIPSYTYTFIPYSVICCPHLLNSFLSGLPKHYQRGVEMFSTHQGRRSKDKLILNIIYFHILYSSINSLAFKPKSLTNVVVLKNTSLEEPLSKSHPV